MIVYSLPRAAAVAGYRRTSAQPLTRAIDRLLEDAPARLFSGARTESAAVTPAMDVAESDATYVVAFDVPGVTRDALKVTIEGRRLSVETVADVAPVSGVGAAAGEAAQPVAGEAKGATEAIDGVAAAPARERVLYRERGTARYARTVILPAEVDQAASEAKVENGVLTLTLVKKVPTGARQIRIS
jgi:HSP20 family protein